MFATILDRYPVPPCASLLGLEILEADKAAGTVRIRFEAKPEFCNASGFIQGGLLTAMLDDTMGPAVLIMTDATLMPVTITLTVSFMAPAKPGPIFGTGVVWRLGKLIGHLEASLEDSDGVELARATSSVRLIKFGGQS
jgi:uncharacterized protein (TIGR00369 family)